MSYLSWKMHGVGVALSIVGTLGLVSAVDARISRKVWDPAYGTDLPALGWSGVVDFEIKDDCLATVNDSGWVYGGFLFGSSTACKKADALSIKSATVTLYDLVGGTNTPADDVTLSFSAGSIRTGNNRDIVPRMWVDVDDVGEKTIRAAQGFYLWPETTEASFAKATKADGGEYDAAAFWLSFNGTKDNDLNIFSPAPPDPDAEDGYSFLYSCSYDYPATFTLEGKLNAVKGKSCSSNDGETFPAVLRPIPEPETYLMGLASFGVLGVWARRRRLRNA